MNTKELKQILSNKLIPEDAPIIINDWEDGDVPYDIKAVQNSFGRWAIIINMHGEFHG